MHNVISHHLSRSFRCHRDAPGSCSDTSRTMSELGNYQNFASSINGIKVIYEGGTALV
jgi:hypothetical protein